MLTLELFREFLLRITTTHNTEYDDYDDIDLLIEFTDDFDDKIDW